ncbi:hypothetical protein DPMN_020059 [Dreissena polymorpha]|uniref:Uncharacterized protein n=1 Tax=Dreissena polymorpha TaxID=45954 RepID=A0A9D4SAQ4_DREPO|nr:hypothetical protein DPMN_020059 [Dreissena polymorpha]
MYFTHASRGYPRALLDDFTAAIAAFPGKPLIKCILEALLLSRKGHQMDPVQFMPQLLGRLEDNETTAEFKQRLREYSSKVWFEPDVNILERTGGQLLHSIHNVKLYNITNGCIDAMIKTGHKKEIYQVVVNDPGTLAAVT